MAKDPNKVIEAFEELGEEEFVRRIKASPQYQESQQRILESRKQFVEDLAEDAER